MFLIFWLDFSLSHCASVQWLLTIFGKLFWEIVDKFRHKMSNRFYEGDSLVADKFIWIEIIEMKLTKVYWVFKFHFLPNEFNTVKVSQSFTEFFSQCNWLLICWENEEVGKSLDTASVNAVLLLLMPEAIWSREHHPQSLLSISLMIAVSLTIMQEAGDSLTAQISEGLDQGTHNMLGKEKEGFGVRWL